MAKMTTEELLAIFEEMSVLELKEFLDAFEEKFDVTAAAPVSYTHLTLPTIYSV